jgi:hypothetical protein
MVILNLKINPPIKHHSGDRFQRLVLYAVLILYVELCIFLLSFSEYLSSLSKDRDQVIDAHGEAQAP